MGEGRADAGAQHPVQRAEAQGADRQHVGPDHPAPELERQFIVMVGALGAEQADRLSRQAAEREPESGRTGRIEPLEVIDDKQDRPRPRQHAQGSPERGRDDARFRRAAGRPPQQESYPERLRLRSRQLADDGRHVWLEQVGQARERESQIALRWRRLQDSELVIAGHCAA
jgi:hypothetical protein